ncbi:septum formation protein Maf [bacterium]|nr:MAG: septum formation protein Maf [bacterium]
MKNIILASQSPRRKHLLGLLYPDFNVIPSSFDEDIPYTGKPSEYAQELAKGKAELVAKKIDSGLIIGADTIVVLKDQQLGKPETEEHAFTILKTLSGNTHTVYTGVSLIEKEHGKHKEHTFSVATYVTFRDLSDDEILAYIKTGSPMDKAGSYGIQDDWGAVFVSHIHGDYYNVVGFPLQAFYSAVKHHFPDYLPQVHKLA